MPRFSLPDDSPSVESLSRALAEERRKNHELTEQNRQILEVLGELTIFHSEQRMQNRVLREIANKATIDELTQLPNKRGLAQAYETMQRMSVLRGFECGVIFIDLDDFKVVNDTHGHQAGDQVIAAVAKSLAGRLREGDVLGRLHGDELLALVPGSTIEDATSIAEEFREIVKDTTVEINGGLVGVTASIGVTRAEDLVFGEAVALADGAMYHAKGQGKDQVFEL